MAIGVGVAVPLVLEPPQQATGDPTNGILLETGDFMLLENGNFLTQES